MKVYMMFVILLASCAAAQEWTMFGYDAANTGSTSMLLPPSPSLLWTYEATGALEQSASVAEGLIVVGCADTYVYALDAGNGSLRWRFDCSGKPTESAAISGGMVYITTYDGEVFAVDEDDGELMWAYRTRIDSLSPPKVVGERLFVSSREMVYAFEKSTGNVLWTYALPYKKSWPPDQSAAAAVSEGRVFVSSEYGDAYAFDEATGSVLWVSERIKNKSGLAYPSTSFNPVAAYGKVFYSGRAGLFALDAATGRVIWKNETPRPNFRALAAAGGMVFSSARDSAFYAFDEATGKLRWKYHCGSWATPPTIVDDKVVLGCMGTKTLLILGRDTGEVLWSYQIDEEKNRGFIAQPTVADKRIYVPSQDGNLYVFGAAKNVSFVVRTLPYDAKISVDNRSMGLTPSVFTISEGIHKVKITKEGYFSWSSYVKVSEKNNSLDVTLQQLPSNQTTVENRLTVVSEPAGAGVYFDGEYVGKTPVTIDASPTYHQVKLVKSQFRDWTKTLLIKEGQNKIQAELAYVTGVVRISSEPAGAEVYVNNELLGKAPQTIDSVGGVYVISVVKDGYPEWKRTIQLRPYQDVEITARLNASGDADYSWSIIVLIFVVFLALLAVAFFMKKKGG